MPRVRRANSRRWGGSAVTGSSFLSNTWRVKDEADTSHALERIGEGFSGRLASNAWEEFWPNVSSRVFHHGH